MDTALANVTRMNNLVNEPQFQNWGVAEIEERLDRVVTAFGQFEDQYRTVLNGTVDVNRKMGLRTQYEEADDMYVKVKARMKTRLNELLPPPAPVNAQPAPQVVQVNLAGQTKNTWGYFSGDWLQWKDFRQRFQIAVHDVAGFTDSEKISFLRNSLKGAAADAMQGYGLEAAKYQEFWEALNAKYDQKYTLANHYLANFFSLKKLSSSAGHAELSCLSNTTKGLVRKIEEVNYNVQNWDLLIVHVLQERLNAKYVEKWHGVRNKDENPTIAMMTTFLDDMATAAENQERSRQSLKVSVPNEYAQRNAAAGGAGAGDGGRTFLCAVCKSTEHNAENCGDFYPLSFSDRSQLAKQNNMCHICLKRGHHKKNCWSLLRCEDPSCRGRDDRHHPLLCAAKVRGYERVHSLYSQRNDRPSNARDTSRDSRYGSNRGGDSPRS